MMFAVLKKNRLIHTIEILLILVLINTPSALSAPKPVPRMQVIPIPYHQASFQRDGVEIARYHFGSSLNRPFIYPVIGPSGRYLTRISHPHDPIGHRHHYSIWLAHHKINDIDFWSESDKTGKQVHQNFLKFEDEPDFARMIIEFGFGDIYSRPGLDIKIRQIITVAALTALGTAPLQLRNHINRALILGWSRNEVLEVIMQMAVYAGFPAALNAIYVTKEVFDERDAKGE